MKTYLDLVKQLATHIEKIRSVGIESLRQLEDYRIEYLGPQGILKKESEKIKEVAIDYRKIAGESIHDFKDFLESHYLNTKERLSPSDKCLHDEMDITLVKEGKALDIDQARNTPRLIHCTCKKCSKRQPTL